MPNQDPLFDYMIHGDEFRLRLLVTDSCNMSCRYCLNDFQKKGNVDHPNFLDPVIAKKHIAAYAQFMYMNRKKPIVTISGGEPGLYPHLLDIIQYCENAGVSVVLVSNGLVLNHKDWTEIESRIDKLHLHVFPNVEFHSKIKDLKCKVVAQAVFTHLMDEADVLHLVTQSIGADTPIKFFVDFHASQHTNARYENIMRIMMNRFPAGMVQTRFTGIQQNRGAGCIGCGLKCITLKALWVFTDGTASACPQGRQDKWLPIHNTNIVTMNAYLSHSLADAESV